MLHTRDHEESNERARIALAHLRHYALKVVDGVDGWKRRITPAVIQNQLAAARFESFQVRIDRIQSRTHLLVGKPGVFLEVEGFQIPGRIVVDHIRKSLCSEKELQPSVLTPTGYPRAPAARPCFAARQKARDEKLALRIAWTGVNFLQRGHLFFCQASVGLGS